MFESTKHPWEMAGDGVVRFHQKHGSHAVILSIDANGVDYEIKNVNGEIKFRSIFEEIDPQTSQVVEKYGMLLRLGVILFVVSIFSAVCNFFISDPSWIATSLWAISGAICLFSYFWKRIAFTVLNTERGRMSIIQDKNHDNILRELNLRRVATLRSKYLQIDHDNNRKTEIAKYSWLRRVGAITDVELTQFASMLQGDPNVRHITQPPTISQN